MLLDVIGILSLLMGRLLQKLSEDLIRLGCELLRGRRLPS